MNESDRDPDFIPPPPKPGRGEPVAAPPSFQGAPAIPPAPSVPPVDPATTDDSSDAADTVDAEAWRAMSRDSEAAAEPEPLPQPEPALALAPAPQVGPEPTPDGQPEPELGLLPPPPRRSRGVLIGVAIAVPILVIAAFGAGVAVTGGFGPGASTDATSPSDAPDDPGPGAADPVDSTALGDGTADDGSADWSVGDCALLVWTVVSCDTPHSIEVTGATVTDPSYGETFPGFDALWADHHEWCDRSFTEYTGLSSEPVEITHFAWMPDEYSWPAGDRDVFCVIVDPEFTDSLEGSLSSTG